MRFMGDGNAIYLSGAGKNNKILRNYIHDNYSLLINANIRSDDEQHETIINGNIVANTMAEALLIKGRCEMEYNILYNLIAQYKDGRYTHYNRGYLAMPTGVVDGSIFKHNIVVSKIPHQTIVYEGKGKLLGKVVYENMDVDSNLYFNENQDGWAKKYFQFAHERDNEQNSIEKELKFAKPEHDFTFDSNVTRQIAFIPDSSAIEFARTKGHKAEVLEMWWPDINTKKENGQKSYKQIEDLYIIE
jgi:hypothetical protein